MSRIELSDDSFLDGTIKANCYQFLKQSHGIPVCKSLQNPIKDFSKVKIRYKKSGAHMLDEAFDVNNLYNKALFTQPSFIQGEGNNVYVFPIDGYKYLYANPEHVGDNIHDTIDSILNNLGINDNSLSIVQDVIAQRYNNKNLLEGLEAHSSIIFYNIPNFYVMNTKRPYDEIYDGLL